MKYIKAYLRFFIKGKIILAVEVGIRDPVRSMERHKKHAHIQGRGGRGGRRSKRERERERAITAPC